MTLRKKIGMCVYCGGSFSTLKTILLRDGTEICKGCAEIIGIEEEEKDDEMGEEEENEN